MEGGEKEEEEEGKKIMELREKVNSPSILRLFAHVLHLPPQHYVEYTTNIDITSYENGKRQTHNPTGRAHASGVWEFYKVLQPSMCC